jgi:hypothetical protein
VFVSILDNDSSVVKQYNDGFFTQLDQNFETPALKAKALETCRSVGTRVGETYYFKSINWMSNPTEDGPVIFRVGNDGEKGTGNPSRSYLTNVNDEEFVVLPSLLLVEGLQSEDGSIMENDAETPRPIISEIFQDSLARQYEVELDEKLTPEKVQSALKSRVDKITQSLLDTLKVSDDSGDDRKRYAMNQKRIFNRVLPALTDSVKDLALSSSRIYRRNASNEQAQADVKYRIAQIALKLWKVERSLKTAYDAFENSWREAYDDSLFEGEKSPFPALYQSFEQLTSD